MATLSKRPLRVKCPNPNCHKGVAQYPHKMGIDGEFGGVLTEMCHVCGGSGSIEKTGGG
jgi:hypothetical protein